jgi:tetratricopeptide (TPR) repeat protein
LKIFSTLNALSKLSSLGLAMGLLLSLGCASLNKSTDSKSWQKATQKSKRWTVSKAKNHAKGLSDRKRKYFATSFYLRAYQAALKDMPRSSSVAYQISLVYDPDRSYLQVQLAQQYIKLSKMEKAIRLLEEVLDRDPKYLEARVVLAGIHSAFNRNKKAREHYEKILALDPTHEEALMFISSLETSEGRHQVALDYVDRLLENYPENAFGWFVKGTTFQNQKRVSQAINAYEKALSVHPGFTQAGLTLVDLYVKNGQDEKANRVLHGLFDYGVQAAGSFLISRYSEKKDFERAEGVLEKMILQNPSDLDLRSKLGLLLVRSEKYDKAEEQFLEILKKEPKADKIRLYLGAVRYEQSRFKDAVSILKEVESSSEYYTDATLQIGDIHLQAEEIQKAEDWVKDAMKKVETPSRPFYQFLSSLHMGEKNYAKAKKVIQEALAHFPENINFMYQLGVSFDSLGDWPNSEKMMRKVIDREPDNAHALNYIGYSLLLREERMEEAGDLIQKALKSAPDNGAIRDSYGWYLFKTGEIEAAKVELEKAVEALGYTNLEVVFHLAEVYLELEQKEEAVSVLKLALSKVDSESAKDEILDQVKKFELPIATFRVDQRRPAEAQAKRPASESPPSTKP